MKHCFSHCQRHNARIQPLTPALKRFYFARGLESATKMGEDAPMVEYMRHEIEQLLESAACIDDPSAVIGAWDEGFRTGLVERIRSWRSVEDALNQLKAGKAVIEVDTRNMPRIFGTLHKKNGGDHE